MKVHIAGLNKNDFTNGIGVTVSLFLQGCPHHCEGCHNPETWDIHGGKVMEYTDLLNEIKEAISANGIIRNFTLSGGDPLSPYNLDISLNLLHDLKDIYPNIQFYIWTGYSTNWTLALLENQDWLNGTIIITEPFILAERDITLPLRGSRNQQIIRLPNENITNIF
jgi:anaerobic ribonucleoside-triphosphate reductase activating protein